MGFLNPSQDDDYRIAAMPTTTDVPPAGALEGALTAIPKGVAGGLAKVENLALDSGLFDGTGQLDYGAHAIVSAFSPDYAAADAKEREATKAQTKVLAEWAATGQDPRKTGTVGRILTGTAEGLTIGATGSVAGPWGAAALLGAAEGYGSYTDARSQGVDKETSKEQAILTGLFSAAGALLPMKFGSNVATSVAGGAAANVTLGAAQRGLTSRVLEAGGYKEMADQYRIYDGESVLADAILGSAFGVMGHYSHAAAQRTSPADVDAAAAVAAEDHFNRSAPGVPTDPLTATLHADTMAASLTALHDGELPDIPPERAQQLVDNVLPDPMHEMAQPLHDAAMEDLPGYAAATANVPRVELPELKPAPLWSAIWESTWQTADYLTTGGLIRSMVEGTGVPEAMAQTSPREKGPSWSKQTEAKGVPLDDFHDAMLGDLVHNHGDEVYEYRPVYDIDGMRVEPVTYRQVAEEMQRQRDEIETFSKLHDVAAACAARHGTDANLLPAIQLGSPYSNRGSWND